MSPSEVWLFLQSHPAFLPLSWFFSALSISAFAFPSYRAVFLWLKPKPALKLLVTLSLFALIFEGQAIITGIPYGQFHYGPLIGYKILDLVPWTVPFAWVPLVLGSAAIASRLSTSLASRVVITALLLTLMDLVLDPGAAILGFWIWDNPVGFYGVPWSNFLGWFLSGLFGGAIFFSLTPTTRLPLPGLLASSFAILIFWSSVAAFFLMWIPLLIGIGLLAFFVLMIRYEQHTFSRSAFREKSP